MKGLGRVEMSPKLKLPFHNPGSLQKLHSHRGIPREPQDCRQRHFEAQQCEFVPQDPGQRRINGTKGSCRQLLYLWNGMSSSSFPAAPTDTSEHRRGSAGKPSPARRASYAQSVRGPLAYLVKS